MSGERRPFTITKLERHPDGYWTARVTSGDETVPVSNRYGAWHGYRRLAPRSRTWLMADVLPHVALELQRKVQRLEKRTPA